MKYSKVQYKYYLEETVEVQTSLRPVQSAIVPGYIFLGLDGKMIIYRRYAWDGITNGVNFKSNRIPGLVHDATYQLIREGLIDLSLKEQSDKDLRDMMIAEGSWKFVSNFFYFCVSKFGNAFATKKKKIYAV